MRFANQAGSYLVADFGFCCTQLDRLVADSAAPLIFDEVFREWSLKLIRVPPGERVAWRETYTAQQRILFCPSCGTELPSSLRLRYFADMEELGITVELFYDSEVPEAYRSDRWWRDAGL